MSDREIGELGIRVTANANQFSNVLQRASADAATFKRNMDAAGAVGGVLTPNAAIPGGAVAAGQAITVNCKCDGAGGGGGGGQPIPDQAANDENRARDPQGGFTVGNALKIAAFFRLFEAADIFGKQMGLAVAGTQSFTEAMQNGAIKFAESLPLIGGFIEGLGLGPGKTEFKAAPLIDRVHGAAMSQANRVADELARGEKDRSDQNIKMLLQDIKKSAAQIYGQFKETHAVIVAYTEGFFDYLLREFNI